MNVRKILGFVLVVVGVALFVFGGYVSGQVDDGRKKIKSAEQGVNFSRRITRSNQYTKDIGEMATQSAQRKIDQGRRYADSYQTLAFWLSLSGIIVFAVGILLFIIGFFHRKNK